MTIALPRKFLSLYLAVCMALLAPLLQISQARAEAPGIKTVVVGGLVGAGLLFAAKAFLSPGKAVAAVAARPGLIGGLLAKVGGFLKSPYILIPALLIGGGLLAYNFYQKYYSPSAYARDNYLRYERVDGQRYQNPAYAAAVAPGVNTQIGAMPGAIMQGPYGSIGPRPITFMDQLKMTLSGGAYIPQSMMNGGYGMGGYGMNGYGAGGLGMGQMGYGYGLSAFGGNAPMPAGLGSSVGLYAGFGAVGVPQLSLNNSAAFNLRSSATVNGLGTTLVVPSNGIAGTAFDVPGVGDPARLGRTDVIGRGLTGGDFSTAANRSSLQGAAAPSTTTTPTADPGSASLGEAQTARDAAYRAMLDVMTQARDGDTHVDVEAAVRTYQAAQDRLQALTTH